MPRAIIRVILSEITDDKAIEIKKLIEKVVKEVPKVEVELTVMGR